MPRAIRQLFCNILTDCCPTSPKELFERFSFCMSEDFVHTLKREYPTMTEELVEQHAYNKLLLSLNELLSDKDKSTKDYDIDEPDPTLTEQNHPSHCPASELDDDATQHFDTCEPLLTEGQRNLYTILKDYVDRDLEGVFRFDAPGGSGKTFVSDILLSYVRKDKDVAIACALSGIAATLMRLGTTFHRRWRAPIPCFEDSLPNMKLNSDEANIIRRAKIIIIDEVSMMHANLLDMLDNFLKILMETDKIMGGKLVVLMHDFRQILPVVPGGRKVHILNAAVFNAQCWHQFTELHLNTNMRVEKLVAKHPERSEELRRHAQWLLALGNGTLPTRHQNLIEIPKQMVVNSIHELEEKVYDNFEDNYLNPDYLFRRAIMSSTNDVIQERNFQMISKLPGDLIISESHDECVEDKDKTTYEAEYLNRINTSGIPPHRLALKKGACIILIRNLNVAKGHCNVSTSHDVLHVT